MLCAREDWDQAAGVAEAATQIAARVPGGLGRALEAAAAYGLAFQQQRQDDTDAALESLRRAARLGRESGEWQGAQVTLDALVFAGHLVTQRGRREEGVALLGEALRVAADVHTPAARVREAQAAVNLGHQLLALERRAEACDAYARALESGSASGRREGRAAASNAALNLASIEDSEPPARRGRLEVARALGRASGTPLGLECARRAEEALADEREG